MYLLTIFLLSPACSIFVSFLSFVSLCQLMSLSQLTNDHFTFHCSKFKMQGPVSTGAEVDNNTTPSLGHNNAWDSDSEDHVEFITSGYVSAEHVLNATSGFDVGPTGPEDVASKYGLHQVSQWSRRFGEKIPVQVDTCGALLCLV